MNFSSANGLAGSEEVWVEVCKDLSRKVVVRREESSGGGRYRELEVPGAGAFQTPHLCGPVPMSSVCRVTTGAIDDCGGQNSKVTS